jgi:hypothetical protein
MEVYGKNGQNRWYIINLRFLTSDFFFGGGSFLLPGGALRLWFRLLPGIYWLVSNFFFLFLVGLVPNRQYHFSKSFPRAPGIMIPGIGAVSRTIWDDLLLLVRRAGHKHAGVGAPAPQFVKIACYTHPWVAFDTHMGVDLLDKKFEWRRRDLVGRGWHFWCPDTD